MGRIQDGQGLNRYAKVDSYQRLFVNSISQSTDHWANTLGNAYSIVIQQTPSAANDCFFYMKNLSAQTIIIEGFGVRVPTNERILTYLADTGTPSGGTDITPRSLNTRSTTDAIGTFQVGNDITGLIRGRLNYRTWVAASDQTQHFNYNQDIIIPTGGVFSIVAEVGGIQIDMNLDLFYTTIEV